MTKEEFVIAFTTYFNMEKTDTTKIRLNALVDWIKKKELDFQYVLNISMTEYVPTNLNPYPLVSHINELLFRSKKEETKNNESIDKQEAQNVADRIITAINKYSYTMPKEARQFIGELGWRVVHECYGNWHNLSCDLKVDQVEMTRSHLRDSAFALIGRMKRGVADIPPSLPDCYKKQERLEGEKEMMSIKDIIKMNKALGV